MSLTFGDCIKLAAVANVVVDREPINEQDTSANGQIQKSKQN